MLKAPSELGRGIVIPAGTPAPESWANVPTVLVEPRTLAHPAVALGQLHRAWASRQPVVVQLGLPAADLRQVHTLEIEPYELDPSFEFEQERLHFLTWANNYDATRGEPIWWHARLAQQLGAPADAAADIFFEGAPRWCDGGPRASVPFPVVHRESIESRRLVLTTPLYHPALLESLDSEQNRAVGYQGGTARVLAPAGSGKTRVLTGRFAYLLASGFEAQRVSALAYNRRAAREMVSRLSGASRSVRTLHALGYGLLRRYRGVTVASAAQVRQILRGLVISAPQLNTDPLAPYLEALQRVRLGLVDPETVEGEREDIPGFAKVYPRYRRRLAEAGLVDHDEQIYGAIELLLRDPEARKVARQTCTHLLVDEFQDLTPAFLLFIRLLSAPGYQVFGVGDDDQVIYSYTGATPDYLVRFAEYFPAAESHLLKTNYRCPAGIVSCANHLLSRNKQRVPKNASAANPSPDGPEVLLAENNAWTVRALQQIELWMTEHEPSEIAVLARVNALLMPLQVALRQAGLAHTPVVDQSVLERTGIRSAMAYWRLCRDSGGWRAHDLQDALRRPNRKLRKEIMETASRCLTSTHLRRYALTQDPWPASQLEEFLADLDRLRKRGARGPAAFFRALRTETEFTSALDQLDAPGLSTGSSHQDDLFALEQLAVLCDSDDFEGWLEESLRPQEADPEADANSVCLSSVHRVKGLEWPCVLVYGVEQGLFPHRLSEDSEEERRLFHVAITRSSRHCALLGSPKTLSPFIAEMQAPPPPAKSNCKKKRKR